jgi:nicotinate-nucleotide pyrophosphorylase (carboxylating)
MINFNCNNPLADDIIKTALCEDIGCGDRTTMLLVDPESMGRARVIAKQAMTISGIGLFAKVFQLLDSEVEFVSLEQNGSVVSNGDIIAEINGPYSVLLTGERTALNFLQHLSGIATLTSCFVDKIKSYKATLLDTRKTTPGLRCFEKEAVLSGGGTNHRMGLYDAVLIKENHIAACGGIVPAVKKARGGNTPHLVVEVEVKTIAELMAAIDVSPDIIMLDNMSIEEMRKAVEIAGGRISLEASGNVTLESIAGIAATGVDYISVGAVTHSASAVDLSMIIKKSD